MLHGGGLQEEIEYDFSVNLNPLEIPTPVVEAVEQGVARMNRYPDYSQEEARRTIAAMEQVAPEEVLCGNGASELLQSVLLSLDPKKMMVAVPSFYGYLHAARACRECEVFTYSLKEQSGFCLDEGILEFLNKDLDVLILTNPNNPTGRVIDEKLLSDILAACKENNIVLLVDECFLRMSDGAISLVKQIRMNSNVYILNAFTKLFSIPGVRIGYVISASVNIRKLQRFLPEWNLSVFAEKAAVAASEVLMTTDYERQTKAFIRGQREYLREELSKLGITVFPSESSFLLIRVTEKKQQELFHFLLKKKILIRDCESFDGLTSGYYRIAVKGPAENQIFLSAMREYRSNRMGEKDEYH